jgi:hypothetical protein
MAMSRLLLPALAATLLATSATAANATADAYLISVAGGFYTGIHDSIAITRFRDGGGAKNIWIAERRRRTTQGLDGPVVGLAHDWIDGRSCPGLGPIIGQIALLARTKRSPIPPPFHGVRVNVTTVGRDGSTTRLHDYEGPVALWWRAAEAELKPCWQDQPIELNGAPLPATLDSDEAERRFTPAPSEW